MYRADVLQNGERIARFKFAQDAVTAAQAIANYTGQTLLVVTKDNDTEITPDAA